MLKGEAVLEVQVEIAHLSPHLFIGNFVAMHLGPHPGENVRSGETGNIPVAFLKKLKKHF